MQCQRALLECPMEAIRDDGQARRYSKQSMSELLAKLGSPITLLYTFVVLTQVASGFYLARDVEPPPSFALLYPLGLLWAIGWWLLKDSRARDIKWVYDLGLFLYIAWPFVVIYYLLKTRGTQGLFVILSFVGVYAGALMLGMMLHDILAR
jgi:hypothetical protein